MGYTGGNMLYHCFQNIKNYTTISKVTQDQIGADFQKKKFVQNASVPPLLPSLPTSRPGKDAPDKKECKPMRLDRPSKGL